MKYTVLPRLRGPPSCFTDEGSVLPADAITVCDATKSKPKESFQELCLSQGRGPDVEAKISKDCENALGKGSFAAHLIRENQRATGNPLV